MKAIYLEHANITVNSIERAVDFFKAAFPQFEIRGGGEREGRKWIHLGNDTTYLAINEGSEKLELHKEYDSSGINHIGFVVDNVNKVAERLISAGFKRDYPKETEQYRIRDYFADDDGNQYEFVQYLSNVPEERNKY